VELMGGMNHKIFKGIVRRKKAMERLKAEGIGTDLVVRLRRERDLIEQLRSDYCEVNRLNEKVRKGQASKEEKEDLLRLKSWIQMESGHLGEIEGEEIEGVICADMKGRTR
jgi:hypothetical protein